MTAIGSLKEPDRHANSIQGETGLAAPSGPDPRNKSKRGSEATNEAEWKLTIDSHADLCDILQHYVLPLPSVRTSAVFLGQIRSGIVLGVEDIGLAGLLRSRFLVLGATTTTL